MRFKRYICGNGDGMYEDKKGVWVEYAELYKEIKKLMTINQAFEHLLNNWKEQQPEFKDKYRSYKSKYLKSLKYKKAEKIGQGKIFEMLEAAGYTIEIKVKPPKK